MKIRKLSIIVPVYNEAATVGKVIERLSTLSLGKTRKEIIVVDDGSTDGSTGILSSLKSQISNHKSQTNSKFQLSNFKFIFKKSNEGKGAAIRDAVKVATGDYVIIQDADLEYRPEEMKKLVAMVQKSGSPAIFGTRNRGVKNTYAYPVLYWGAKVLIRLVNELYDQKLSDPECCYKMIKRDRLNFEIEERGFGVEVELTAKLARQGIKIGEVPIKYRPRTYAQGKKITAGDGIRAVWLAVKWAV